MTTPSLLPEDWELPIIFRRRIGDQVGRQRPMVAEGQLLLVLHAPPHPDQTGRVGRFFWRSLDECWRYSGDGDKSLTIHQHLDEYEHLVDRCEQQEESAQTADEYFKVLEQLPSLLRTIGNLHQALQEARKECPDFREIINLRDRAYALDRTAELLYNSTKIALEVEVARRAEVQARASEDMAWSAHRLNRLVAFFFPIATLTSVFGVSLKHGLEELSAPWAFLTLIGFGLLLGLILTRFIDSSDQ
jgi:uncharacterized membrane protein